MTDFRADLRAITEALTVAAGDGTVITGLGGDFGYGYEHQGPVFDMMPESYDDCGCGHDDEATIWLRAHPHATDCYQKAVAALEYGDGYDHQKLVELAAAWGLPAVGIAVHCTCDREPLLAAWSAEHSHDPKCVVVRPNFRHHASGIEIRWYKYIGRSMEVSRDVERREWNRIVDECIDSIKVTADQGTAA
jgi:hypothetical protein